MALPTGALSRLSQKIGGTLRPVAQEAVRMRDVAEHNVIRSEAAPVRELEKVAGKDVAKRWDVVQTANVRSSAANLAGRVMDIGIWPNANKRTAAFNDVVRRANSLAPAKKQDVVNSLNAAAHLDSASVDPTYATAAEINQWRAIVNRATKDADIRTIHNQLDSIRIGALDLLHSRGMTTAQQHADLVKRRGYLHRPSEAPDDPNGSFVFNLFNDAFIGKPGKRDMLMPGLQQRNKGMKARRADVDPFKSTAKMIEDAVRYSGENQARVEWIDVMNKHGAKATVVKRLGSKDKPTSGRVLHVMRNGEKESYEIGDTRVYNALRYNNHWIMPAFNEMRKWEQTWTTGVGAPNFSITSLKYDTGFGLIGMRTRDMVSGQIDAWLKEHGGDKDLVSLGPVKINFRDLVAPIVRATELAPNLAHGFKQAAIGRAREETVRTAIRKASDAGLYDPTMPLAVRRKLDAELSKAYNDYFATRYSHLVGSGYMPNIVSTDMAQASVTDKFIKGNLEKTQAGRAYVGFLDTVREASRMAWYSRNVAMEEKKLRERTKNPNAKLTKKDYDRIAYEVRRVAADPSAVGEHGAVTATLSTIPFGNTTLQSTWHLARQFSNPAAYATMVWGVGGYLALRELTKSNMGEDEYERLMEKTPMYKRTLAIMVPKPEAFLRAVQPGKMTEPWTEDDMMWIGLGPELGAFIVTGGSVVSAFYDAVTGDEGGLGEPSGWETAGAAALNLLSFATPPVINWVQALKGEGRMDLARASFSERQAEAAALQRSNEMLPDYRAHGLSSGWIGEREAALLRMAFGVNASALTEAAERTIDAEYNEIDDLNYQEGARDAMGVIVTSVARRNPIVTTLFPDAFVERDSRGTPLADRYYDVKGSLAKLVDQESLIRGHGIEGNISKPVHVPDGVMLVPRVHDPILRTQLKDVVGHYRNNRRDNLLDEISALEKKSGMVRGSVHLAPNAANAAYNGYLDALADRQREVLQDYEMFEDRMQRKYNDPDWTLERFTSKVLNDLENN